MEHIKQPEGGLLQSFEWGRVQRAEGRQVVAITEELFGIVQTLPVVGRYLYVPRGSETAVKNIEGVLAKAKEHDCNWVRTDLISDEQLHGLRDYRLCKAPHDMQPKDHLIIDMKRTADELLADMKGKWRYNIRLAEKKNVVPHYVTRSDHDFEQLLTAFHELVGKTGSRKGVTFHGRDHYAQMFENLPENAIALYLAEYENEIIAANIVTFWNGTATYLHGGADPEYRNLMAPHLLQWHALRAAIGRGCSFYDFGGVYPDSADSGKAGITKFKQGFSPTTEITSMSGSYDIIISPWKYHLYRILQKVKR